MIHTLASHKDHRLWINWISFSVLCVDLFSTQVRSIISSFWHCECYNAIIRIIWLVITSEQQNRHVKYKYANMQDSSFQTGLSLTFPLRTIEEITLNWTEWYGTHTHKTVIQQVSTYSRGPLSDENSQWNTKTWWQDKPVLEWNSDDDM